jgi:phage shock protein C
MTERKLLFSLDRRDAKLLGVCAGLGKRFGIDPTILRVAWVAIPLLTPVSIKAALIAYLIAYLIAGVVGYLGRKWSSGDERSSALRTSIHSLRTRTDRTDRQMMAVDAHLASQNDALAREIDALREDPK